MKKHGISLFIILLLAAMFTVVAFADVELPATCPHCNKAVTWRALNDTDANADSIAAGHYYLNCSDTMLIVSKKTISENVCIYMNGKTLQAKDDRVFDVTGELALIGEGSVLGRAFADSNKAGGTIYVSGTLDVYGTTISTTAESGRGATNGGVIYVTGTMTMHSGTVTGGVATKNGGTISVGDSGKLVMNDGTVAKGKASNAGGSVYIDSNATLEAVGGNINNGTASVSNCVFAKGTAILSGSANITQLRISKLAPEKLIFKGAYTGKIQLCFLASTYQYLVDGDVVGTCDNADLTAARISIYDRACYVKAVGDDLQISLSKPVAHRTAYCEACKKDVEWVALTEMDRASGDMETGHYFLDIVDGGYEFGTKNVKGYNRICLDLNGKIWDSTDRAFRVYSGILNVMDSVGGGEIVGRGTTDSSITGGTIRVQPDAELNLYSGSLTYKDVADDGRGVVIRGGVVYVAGGVFNMYGGKIYGGAAKYGANVAVWNDGTHYGHFNMYGGEIGANVANASGASTKGPGVYSTCYVTISGNSIISNLYLAENNTVTFDEMLTIDGEFTGSVAMTFASFANCRAIGYGKNADFSKASISFTNSANLNLARYGNKLLATTGREYLIELNGAVTTYETLQKAIDAYTEGTIALLTDVSASTAVTIDKDIILDLNGYSFNGTVAGSGTIYCLDGCTDDYTVADGVYGKISASVANVVAVDGYFEIVEDGARSFHRLDLKIKKVTLRTSAAGIYYQCDFAGDEMIQARISAFGIALNTKEAPNVTNMNTTSMYTSYDRSAFNSGAANSVLLANIFKEENSNGKNRNNAAVCVYGRAYVVVGDQYIYGQTVSCSFQQALTAANEKWSNLTVKQKIGLMELYGRFTTVMEPYASSFKSTYETIQRRNAIDYSPYMAPWTENVVEKAKADGKLHYYFMAGEGGAFSNGTYNEKWGDSYLLVFPNGQTMLIDTGYSSYGPMLTQNLKQMGVKKLDYLVITHPHNDHQGGAFYDATALNTEYGILHCFEIGQVFYRGGYDPDSTGATIVKNVCEQLDLPLDVLEKGDSLEIAGVRLDVIWPLAGEGDTMVSGGVEINDKSVVFRVEYGEHTALLTGDLYVSGEEGILASTDLELLDVDLLKVPHHGYDTTSSIPAFIKATSPEIAVALGRVPREATIDRYTSQGCQYLCDWLNGYIHIEVGTDGVMTETHTRNNVPADFGDIKDDDSDIEEG